MRKKVIKMRGSKTHGYGSKKKHRGAGSRGGRGYAGSFKHKRVYLRKFEPEHFEKQKFKSLRVRKLKKRDPSINLRDIEGKEFEFQGNILAAGNPPKGIVVKAKSFSEKAKEKIEKSGGKAIQL